MHEITDEVEALKSIMTKIKDSLISKVDSKEFD